MTVDEQLLVQAKQFDPEALQTLHQQFYNPIYRYIYLKVSDSDLGDDLTSDVFIRMLEALKQGRGWTSTPGAWIFGIARNVVADYYRRRQRQPEVMLDERMLPVIESNLFQRVVVSQEREALVQAINQLTDEQRDVILLRFMEGLSIKDVAEVMDKTPGAIKTLQYRSIRALAKAMRPNEG